MKDKDDEKPFHRRVVERIAQGLQDVQAATASGTPTELTQKYEQGFNANLCETLLRMLETVGDRGLEFSVRWSPIAKPPSASQKTVHFQPEAIDYLQMAVKELRSVQRTNRVTITGLIARLGTANLTQTIVINYGRQPVRVSLGRADYRAACDAHRDGERVRMSGVLEKRGRTRTLTGVSDFQVLTLPS